MTQLSVTEFLDLVERSGLVAKDPLGQAIADLEQDGSKVTDSRVVSSHLVSAGLLTHWQCDLLLEGRYRGFFVGRYRLLDHLGEGTTSVVYLGEHVVMGRRVAMKFLPTHRVNGASWSPFAKANRGAFHSRTTIPLTESPSTPSTLSFGRRLVAMLYLIPGKLTSN